MYNFNHQDDTYWVELAGSGHQVAFNNLVDKYQQPVYNLCYRMLQDATEAEDAAQETFIKAYYKLNTYDKSRKFSTWLFSIASNHCVDRLRRRRFQWVSWQDLSPWSHPAAKESTQPEWALLNSEAQLEIQSLLDTLPADSRTAVVLKYWHKMSYEDIAQTLDTSVSAVKSKLFRARKALATRATAKNQTRPTTHRHNILSPSSQLALAAG